MAIHTFTNHHSVPGKIYAKLLEKRLRDELNDTIKETQCGLRKGRGKGIR